MQKRRSTAGRQNERPTSSGKGTRGGSRRMSDNKFDNTDRKPARSGSGRSSFGDDKPKRTFKSRDEAGAKPFRRSSDDKPKRAYGSKSDGAKPYSRSNSDSGAKPRGRYNDDKPKRTFRDKPESTDSRPFRLRSNEDKPFRKFDGDAEKPRRSFSSDKPSFEKRGFDSDRPKRTYTKREDSGAERKPFRKFDGDAEKPRRSFSSDKPSFEKRGFDSDRPKRNYTKRDDAGTDRKPFRKFDGDADKPRRSFSSDKPSFEKRGFDSDRPKRSYTKRTDDVSEAPDYGNLRSPKPGGFRAKRAKAVTEKADDGTVRLNRYIANSGVCSRREADELIMQGLVTVNGELVSEMGYKVKPGDVVKYDGKTLRNEKPVYVLLNKPKDYITTTDDPQERKTVMQLVAGAARERIYPVGRLDRNTTGLLLFTNDGELAEKLTHPSHSISKVYEAVLDKPITNEDLDKIRKGLRLFDGIATVDDIEIVNGNRRQIGIEIHIGRNRIVRRIFEHLGYEVEILDRVTYAGLNKKNLARGNWRYLTEKEVIFLKHFK